MPDVINRSFGLNIRILKLCGFYPPEQSSFLVKARAYTLFCCFMVLKSSLMVVNLLSTNPGDVMLLVLSGAYTSDTLGYCFKVFPFLKNGRRIKKCINRFADPKFAPKNQQEAKIVEDCVHICRRNCHFYFYGISATTIVWFGSKLLDRKLPVGLWLPFDPSSGPGIFSATFLYLAAGAMYDACAGAMVDPLIGGLAYHATSQLKILKYRLEHFENSVKFLKMCVDHHNCILEFVAEYQECFSFSIISQFAGSMFASCFCCVGIIMDSGAGNDSVISASCFVCIIFQIFFYCYYGTLLFEESKGLNDAIYTGRWYECDSKIRKMLLVMMERSKIPTVITAGKVVNVTLQTFASVLKTSYSLIAVISLTIKKYE